MILLSQKLLPKGQNRTNGIAAHEEVFRAKAEQVMGIPVVIQHGFLNFKLDAAMIPPLVK